MTGDLKTSWCARWAFERGLAAIYLVAFLVAVNQFVPLVGQHGLLPAARFGALNRGLRDAETTPKNAKIVTTSTASAGPKP